MLAPVPPATPVALSPVQFPDALVDKLVVGCRIFLPGYAGGVAALRGALAAALAREGTGSFAPFHCEFLCGETGGRMQLHGGLRPAAAGGGGLCTTSESSVEMNPLLFVRDAVARLACWA